VNALIELIEEIEDGLKRSLRYIRLANYLSTLEVVLVVATIVVATTYFIFYEYVLIVTVVALVVAIYVTDRLSNRYYRKTLSELAYVEKIARMVALTTTREKEKGPESLKEKTLALLTKMQN
jgi:Flp pilus assembly protein TadB